MRGPWSCDRDSVSMILRRSIEVRDTETQYRKSRIFGARPGVGDSSRKGGAPPQPTSRRLPWSSRIATSIRHQRSYLLVTVYPEFILLKSRTLKFCHSAISVKIFPNILLLYSAYHIYYKKITYHIQSTIKYNFLCSVINILTCRSPCIYNLDENIKRSSVHMPSCTLIGKYRHSHLTNIQESRVYIIATWDFYGYWHYWHSSKNFHSKLPDCQYSQ